MSFRNRAVLDRKHRPRWEEERRTQQIVVAAFAVTIAVALGIFGAAAWGSYHDTHLRQVAAVNGITFNRDTLSARTRILQVELGLEAQRVTARTTDQAVLEQQLDALQQQIAAAESAAVESIVTGEVQRQLGDELQIALTEADVDAEIAGRATSPELARLSIIVVPLLAPDAPPGTTPTDEDRERAIGNARTAMGVLRAGTDFGQVAATGSADPSGQRGGDIGYIGADDPRYGQLYVATAGLEVGATIGPIATPGGYTIARVTDRIPAIRDDRYLEAFDRAGVRRSEYRAYIRDELYEERFRTHFAEEVATPRQEQRRAAQIFIREQAGEAVPERRVRHVLIAPLPDARDQTAATEEQWQAALERAQEVRAQLLEPDADWEAIAAEESADPGSGARGGDLGWSPATGEAYVAEFAEAMSALSVGELSEPVRSEFGYHLIEVTDERESAAAYLEEVLAELEDDPTRFPEIARASSEDPTTAPAGGEIGWVAPYEVEPEKEEAIWLLAAVGDVSEPVVVPGEGTFIFQLLEISVEREVEPERLERIRTAGYDRWLAEQEASVELWIDPAFAPAPQAPAAGPQS